MDTQHPSAPASRRGVIHVNAAHTTGYVVVGNHLAQHADLSLTAIGLAVHIQSLPAGTPITVKALAKRLPEGEIRIAGALRELEAAGYLKRIRVRLASGRIATETYSYNNPGALRDLGPDRDPDADRDPDPDPDPGPDADPGPDPDPDSDPEPDSGGRPERRPKAALPPALAPTPSPAPAPTPASVRNEAARLPQGPAAELLTGLRLTDPRLLLSVRDIQRLAPAVDTWFARGAAPEAVARTLTAALPATLQRPAGLLAHRLTTLLPPPVPDRPRAAAPYPLQFCVTCDETAFRAPEPGECPDCVALARERAA
ncbi:hypothetical protein ASC82_18565 [Streptomyces sp. Root431]|uniref:hypothetical protein n=1 Tax=Streptomyces sp. Root431 TaxID=1736535 RepID=UPI0006F235C3|nr:hypothetical protein [Streptomyces sp. Root431]KQX11977.1 hypothetical protein ASC82_18565 [Streptomyces sp. Root431]